MKKKFTGPEGALLKLIGVNIRRLRKQQGYSQEAFADECGTERSYMGSLERGEGNPTILKLRSIANVLKVDISEFFIKGKK